LGLLKCKYGRAFFKEGHDAWRNYNINFVDKVFHNYNDKPNGEAIFKEPLGKK
jgi:hypothetical protein